MKQYEFEIEGAAPLLMDRFADGKSPTSEKEYLEQAKEKVYREPEGNLAIPAGALKAAIREASADIGKKMESRKRRQLIRAFVFIEPEMLSLGKKDFDCIDRRMVTRGKGDKVTRVAAFRPLVKEWKVQGRINVIGEVSPDFLKECLEHAGVSKGLLSYRPEFGRFIVKKFQEV